MNPARLLFAGTPEFALASLKALVESGATPIAVLTQPDRPAGRGKRLTKSPVKIYAESCDIPVLQPATLRDDTVQREIAALDPDLLVVAAYGLILPQAVLDIPRLGCLNVHASLLPRWRGAAPIQAAILAGDSETGISLMAIEAGLDTGPVYATSAIAIGPAETAGELHDRLARLGGELLAEHLQDIIHARLEPVLQDEQSSTYAPKISKDDARLDWQLDAATLARRVRAFNPVPGAWFELDSQRIKCWQAEAAGAVSAAPGSIVSTAEAIVVACGDGTLAMRTLQRPGKRPVTAREFAQAVDLVDRRLT